MYTISVVLLYFLNFFPFKTSANYFCDLPCGSQHIACLSQPCIKGKSCGEKYKMSPLNLFEKQFVVKTVNDLRNHVALSIGESFTSNAADMLVLSYDNELEFVAQCLANHCFVEYFNTNCKATSKFNNVGQNIYTTKEKKHLSYSPIKLLRKAIYNWFESIEEISDDKVDAYASVMGTFDTNAAHLIFSKVSFVGCGRSFNSDSGYLLICLFAPADLEINNDRLFTRGKACSKCPKNMKCNKEFGGLCGTVRELDNDFWQAPFQIGAQSSIYFNSVYCLYMYTFSIFLIIIWFI